MYKIYATDTFKEIYQTLDKSEQYWINKTKNNLKEFPTGKPLGYKWFREKNILTRDYFFLLMKKVKKYYLYHLLQRKISKK